MDSLTGVAMSALPPKADIRTVVEKGLLMTLSGHSALLTNLVVDDATGEAGQERRQGGAARSVRHLSACRGCDSTAAIRRNPATNRRPAAEASTDMTPRVIAAGLNQRGPGARPSPNDRYRTPECILTGARTRRVAQPKPPNRDEWLGFHRCSIVLSHSVAGKSHLGNLR